MWAELVTGFTLGAGAILTNACMLPLYPGLIAFMAAKADDERTRRASGWLGVLVLAGVLSMMLVIGLVLHLLQASFGGLLTTLLPIIYIIVIVFGVLMLFGRNPFARLSQVQSPVVRNPYLTAYLYGVLFAPMTLPWRTAVLSRVRTRLRFSARAAAVDRAALAAAFRRLAGTESRFAHAHLWRAVDRHRDFRLRDRNSAESRHCLDFSPPRWS